MTPIPILLAMLCGGGLLGLFYFGGLWLTIHKLTAAKRWGLWLGASFVLRASITVAAFWFLAAGDWQRILALITGFTISRLILVKRLPPQPEPVA
ncbi:MAG: ATP synthase subunit I [Spirochaetales bacterium]|jgi:F1F0 ATPase subunit 2|nr:ATP synthase subunit I [Spirochaetales bacterium]